jgi:hypothetical protein
LEFAAVIVSICHAPPPWFSTTVRMPRGDVLQTASFTKRQGISWLAGIIGDKPARKTFRSCPIGYFHLDIAELRSAGARGAMFRRQPFDRVCSHGIEQWLTNVFHT